MPTNPQEGKISVHDGRRHPQRGNWRSPADETAQRVGVHYADATVQQASLAVPMPTHPAEGNLAFKMPTHPPQGKLSVFHDAGSTRKRGA